MSGHFPPNFGSIGSDSNTIVHTKNGTEVLYPHAKFGGDQFMHGDVRTKIREFLCLFFVCHTEPGLFWSHRAAMLFGTLMKYTFTIY